MAERHDQAEPDTTLPTGRYDQPERMPLRTDLFLISHDDDTGRPHLEKHSIAVGLAGAILLELWYAGRVRLGWHGNPHQHTWQRNHTHVTLLNATPTNDPIHDAAIGLLWRLGGTVNIKRFIEQFATTDLYEAVRDHLTDTGILRRFYRRRFLFLRTEHRRPANAVHPVKARARIRDVARLLQPHTRDTILTALVVALNLTPHARLIDYSISGLHIQLTELIGPQHPIHDITKAIAPYRLRFQ
jgi:hypothetical protein